MTTPGMSPKAVADKLQVLLVLAPLAPESPTAAKVVNQLAQEVFPALLAVAWGALGITTLNTLRAELAQKGLSLEAFLSGALFTSDTHKRSDDE